MLASQAQHDPVWAIGDHSIRFGGPDAPGLTTTPLPIPDDPNVPAAYKYQGQIADRIQHAEYDAKGELLFFIIDGEVYNAKGYRIVDVGLTPTDRNCHQCFYAGQEVHVFPRPGTCSQYFIISIFSATNGTPIEPPALTFAQNRMRVGLLDLTVENEEAELADANCPVRGAFLHNIQRGQIGLLGGVSDYEEIEGDLVTDPNVFGYCAEGVFTSADAGSGMVRGSTLQLQNDPRGLMFVITEQRMAPLIIEESGLRALTAYPIIWTEWNPVTLESDLVNSVDDNDGSFRGEMALRQVGSQIRVAYSQYVRFQYNGAGPFYHQPRIAYWEFQAFAPSVQSPAALGFTMVPLDEPDPNPKTYGVDLIPFETADPPVDAFGDVVQVPAVGGLEFSPNGRYIYFTKSSAGTSASPTSTFGYVDLNVTCTPGTNCPAFFYPVIGGVGDARQLVDTQLETNISADGTTQALYLIGADENAEYWLSSFTGLDDPSNGVWTSGLLQLDDIALRTAPNGQNQYRLLNRRVAGGDHFEDLQRQTCCEELTLILDVSATVTPNSQLWTPGNNPFCDADGPIYIATDLIIPSGANVQANNLEFRFGEDARLIIHRGGRLSAYNTTFTSACERWPGIRVEGNIANLYQFDNPALPQDMEQGELVLDNSTVENARVGVWCTREKVDGTPNKAYNGGFVRAYYSTFKDCITGVDLQPYRRFDAPVPLTLIELPNRSLFAGCQFKTTADWPGGLPRAMGVLQRVKHVRFLNCSFENEVPELFSTFEAGAGLLLSRALVYVDGSGNPEQSYFKNLSLGVQNASGLFNPVRVKKMHFAQNRLGIFDVGSFNGEYAENTFDLSDLDVDPDYSIGMYLWESKEFIVEENTFSATVQGNAVGIYFYGQQAGPKGSAPEDWTYYDERIYNNAFTNLYAGNVVDGIHRGDASTDVDYGLQLLCGDYTGNFMDIGLNARSLVRPNQGTPSDDDDAQQLAGNRYFTADCEGGDDWVFDDLWNDVESNTSMIVNYKRHELPDEIVGVDCTGLPNLDDIPVYLSGPFNKEQHCTNGEYPIDQVQLGGRREAYRQAKTLLTGAINAYEGTVDLGQTMDVKVAILQESPKLSSAYLRDLLLVKHPLSDQVLGLLIAREEPLDPWHLTQVLLQNSPLSPGIWRTVLGDELLPPFFMALVNQAQQGAGPTVKQVLEQEVAHRRAELAAQQRVLGTIYARDTTTIPLDSLAALPLYDVDEENAVRRFEALVHLGRYSDAQDLLSATLTSHLGKDVLVDILDVHQTTGGDWDQLDAAKRAVLQDHAAGGRTGAAWAAGILYGIGAEVPQPPVRFPDTNKRLSPRRTPDSPVAASGPTVACYPNPTNNSTFVTYPSYLDGSTMLILDAKGDLMRSLMLDGAGVLEMATGQMPDGLYLVNIAGTTFSTKLTVQH